jgi:hypothetical protein
LLFEILPPLWMRANMFAMREFMTGNVTSVFFSLWIDDRKGFFHGYCDLSDRGSPGRMKASITERESRPVRAMTRDERLEHIWSSTHDDHRVYAGKRWTDERQGQRTLLIFCASRGTVLKLLDDLTDEEISAKLPEQLRHHP